MEEDETMKKSEQQAIMQPVTAACNWSDAFDVVVIGGVAAGIGVTASLLKRRSSPEIVDSADDS